MRSVHLAGLSRTLICTTLIIAICWTFYEASKHIFVPEFSIVTRSINSGCSHPPPSPGKPLRPRCRWTNASCTVALSHGETSTVAATGTTELFPASGPTMSRVRTRFRSGTK